MADFKLTPLSKIINKPYKHNWLIKNLIEAHSIGMLFGAPASAKSFIAMDMAFCIAAGIDWNGNVTTQGKVVYLAGEGFNGIRKRFKALELKYNTSASDIFISDLPASFVSSLGDNGADNVMNAINKLCPNPTLIVIDTLHRNFGNGDENSARDFGVFINLISSTIMSSGAAVLLIHHSGHGSADRGRGSSSIRAAMDVEYKITKEDNLVSMECKKAKEFEAPPGLSFNLITQLIPTWLDDEGKPTESAILESTTYSEPVKVTSLTAKDKIVLQALIDITKKDGKLASDAAAKKYPELAGEKYIHVDKWRAEAYSLLDKNNGGKNTPQANQKAFARAKGKLVHTNIIKTEDDCYWEA